MRVWFGVKGLGLGVIGSWRGSEPPQDAKLQAHHPSNMRQQSNQRPRAL